VLPAFSRLPDSSGFVIQANSDNKQEVASVPKTRISANNSRTAALRGRSRIDPFDILCLLSTSAMVDKGIFGQRSEGGVILPLISHDGRCPGSERRGGLTFGRGLGIVAGDIPLAGFQRRGRSAPGSERRPPGEPRSSYLGSQSRGRFSATTSISLATDSCIFQAQMEATEGVVGTRHRTLVNRNHGGLTGSFRILLLNDRSS